MLEGNPFTYPEVQTLMDGVTVGGHKLSDERQVANLADSAKELIAMVRDGRFVLDKSTSDQMHAIIARDEAFDAGHFRGEGTEQKLTPGVALGEFGRYLPPETQPGGANLMMHGIDAISVPAARAQEFNTLMVDFYRYKDGTRMIAFLTLPSRRD